MPTLVLGVVAVMYVCGAVHSVWVGNLPLAMVYAGFTMGNIGIVLMK